MSKIINEKYLHEFFPVHDMKDLIKLIDKTFNFKDFYKISITETFGSKWENQEIPKITLQYIPFKGQGLREITFDSGDYISKNEDGLFYTITPEKLDKYEEVTLANGRILYYLPIHVEDEANFLKLKED